MDSNEVLQTDSDLSSVYVYINGDISGDALTDAKIKISFCSGNDIFTDVNPTIRIIKLHLNYDEFKWKLQFQTLDSNILKNSNRIKTGSIIKVLITEENQVIHDLSYEVIDPWGVHTDTPDYPYLYLLVKRIDL